MNNSYSSKWHYSYSSYSFLFFFIFLSSVCTFFFLLYIVLYWYNKFHNIFTIIEMSISFCCFSVLALFIYSTILVSHFVFFFLKFWTVATVPSGIVATVVTIFFFFFQSSVCTFFFPFYICCYTDTTNFIIFSQVSISYKSK